MPYFTAEVLMAVEKLNADYLFAMSEHDNCDSPQ